MNRVAVVYWSGTGNTEAMALAVAEGIRGAGAEATMFPSAQFRSEQLDSFDAAAFGCPAMGAEVLEEDAFEPMFTACEGQLSGRKIALFGSYGWGDGVWMRDWSERCDAAGAVQVCPFVICNEAPDVNTLKDCRALGAALAKSSLEEVHS